MKGKYMQDKLLANCYNNREGVILAGANTPGRITTQNLVISILY